MDGKPSVKVDLDRIVNLADQMKRMNLNIEDRVPGLVSELKIMTESLRSDYSESRSVQSTLDETERLLKEVFNLSRSISNQLHQKENSLRKVSAQYAEIEKKTVSLLKQTVKFTVTGWESGLLKSGKSNVIQSKPLMGNAGTGMLNWKEAFKRFVQQPLMLVTGAPLLQRLEHVKEDERISLLLRQMESGNWAEREQAWLELIQIAEAIENLARSQRAYAIYKTYGNGPYMESASVYARQQREKLKQMGVSEKWFGANVNLSGYYSGSPLTACQYNPLKHDASPMPEEPELRFMIAAGLLNNTYRTWVQLTYGPAESAIKRMEAERKDADRILEKAVEYYNLKQQDNPGDFQLYYVSLTLALGIEHGADQIGNLDYWLGQQLTDERKIEIAQTLRDAGTEEVAANSLYVLTPTYEQAQSDLTGGYGAGAPSGVPRRSPGMPKVKTPDIAAETLPSNKLKVKLPALPAADLRKFFQDMRKDLFNWSSKTNLATTGPSIDGLTNNNSKQQPSKPTENQLQYRQVFMDGDGNSSEGSPKKPGDLSGKAAGTVKAPDIDLNRIGTGAVGNLRNIKDVNDLISRIPADAKQIPWREVPGGAKEGIKFRWVDEAGKTWDVRAHSIDPSAPPGSNAANGWIYRVEVKQVNPKWKWTMDSNGNFHKENVLKENSPYYDESIANETHIPFK